MYLKEGCQEDGCEARLFSVVPIDRMRGDGHKMKQRKFCLKTRKKFLTVRVTEKNKLSREVVSPSLEMFKTSLDLTLNNVLAISV